MFEEIFLRKKLIPDNLLKYGFQPINGKYRYVTEIHGNEFVLTIAFDGQGKLFTALNEKDTGEDYSLYKTFAQGAFVGQIRSEISSVLEDIADKCFSTSVFKQEQTLHIIDYIAAKYSDNLEFLWQKFPDNAVWRRKDTNKWYGAVLTVAKNKLGANSDEVVEIIDLRASPDDLESLLKQNGFYCGWHMNKKNWYTVILDGSIDNELLYKLIEQSYNLAK